MNTQHRNVVCPACSLHSFTVGPVKAEKPVIWWLFVWRESKLQGGVVTS